MLYALNKNGERELKGKKSLNQGNMPVNVQKECEAKFAFPRIESYQKAYRQKKKRKDT